MQPLRTDDITKTTQTQNGENLLGVYFINLSETALGSFVEYLGHLCNYQLYGAPSSLIYRVRKAQDYAAHAIIHTKEWDRRHLHCSEITACVLYGFIPNLLKRYLWVFSIWVRQLFACKLINEKSLCFSQDNTFILCKLVRHKYPGCI